MAMINASSASYADVSNAISSASNGDTVKVPSGTETWTSLLTITKGITLQGNGSASTKITNGRSANDPLIYYNPSDYSLNQSFRLTEFYFDSNGHRTILLGNNGIAPFTANTNVRIDHNHFYNTGGGSAIQKGQFIYNIGSLWGVADNNTFENSGYPVAHTGGQGNSVENWWNNSPQSTFSLGGQYYFYYEDNTVILSDYDGAGGDNILTDGEYAARYVFRYNNITNVVATYSLFDMHGEQSGMASSFGAELYGNNITHSTYEMVFFNQRSGQALIFLNNSDGSGAVSNRAYTGGLDICPTNDCDLKNTHNTYWFGNRKNLTGSFWSDTVSGGLDCCSLTGIPTLGRDVFSANSSPAITMGTFGNRPASPTVGQGYWATDQSAVDLSGMVGIDPTIPIAGTLYICEVEDEWIEFFTPYAYPHPLRAPTSDGGRIVLIM